MSKQDQSLIGRLAVHYKMITMDQLAAVTREQSRQGGGKLLGDLLVEKGLLRPMQLSQLLKVQAQVLAKQQAGGTAAKASAGRRGAPGPQEGTDRLAPRAPQRVPVGTSPAAPPAAAEPSAAERPQAASLLRCARLPLLPEGASKACRHSRRPSSIAFSRPLRARA